LQRLATAARQWMRADDVIKLSQNYELQQQQQHQSGIKAKLQFKTISVQRASGVN